MEYMHYAAIDIGSNAVRLLIKRLDDVVEGRFSKDVLLRVPLRLGQEVFTKGRLSEKKITDLVNLMRSYKILLDDIYHVPRENSRFCATAALREAVNGSEVAERIRREVGFNIEIIDGCEEAAIVSNLRPAHDTRRLVYVDVGGGSTEVSVICGGVAHARKSFPVGTVKIVNGVAPENWRQRLTEAVKAMFYDSAWCGNPDGFNQNVSDAVIVGAGGNISKLFALAQERDADDMRFSVASLRNVYERLLPLSVEQRMITFRLKADRADVIVPAADIFITIAEALGIEEIEIPTNGLADGIVADLWIKKQNGASSPHAFY